MPNIQAKCDLDSRLSDYTGTVAATRRLERRKSRLLAGALLTAGAACAGGQAQASVIYHAVAAPGTLVDASHNDIAISFTNAGGVKHHIRYYAPLQSISIGELGTSNRRVARAAVHVAACFAYHASIGAGAYWALTWQRLCSEYGGNFKGVDGYIGVRFRDSSRLGTCYGWIRFQGAANGLSGYIKGWAYDDAAGTAIRAGEGQ